MTQRMLPLYEGKMIHHFDHRWATHGEHGARDVRDAERTDPDFAPFPRYWVREELVLDRIASRHSDDVPWLAGWRNIARATDERTLIAAALPAVGVGHSLPLMVGRRPRRIPLLAAFSSFVVDYVARQKLGGTNVTFNYVEQFAIPKPVFFDAVALWQREATKTSWIGVRVLELFYNADDMRLFAQELGDTGEPFVWDPERRFLLRCELDAAFFHLYGVARDDVGYIMETFPIVKSKDVTAHGEYRTKRVILEVFDAMQDAIDTGQPYRTILKPPPGDGPRHAAKETVV